MKAICVRTEEGGTSADGIISLLAFLVKPEASNWSRVQEADVASDSVPCEPVVVLVSVSILVVHATTSTRPEITVAQVQDNPSCIIAGLGGDSAFDTRLPEVLPEVFSQRSYQTGDLSDADFQLVRFCGCKRQYSGQRFATGAMPKKEGISSCVS